MHLTRARSRRVSALAGLTWLTVLAAAAGSPDASLSVPVKLGISLANYFELNTGTRGGATRPPPK